MRFSLPPIPAQLEFVNSPADWRITNNDLSITAGERTDWFYAPDGGLKSDNAPVALFATDAADFILQARVEVSFASTYDAGVLFILAANEVWGKLCFEYSPQGQPMVVSVITRGVSDDCNSVVIDGNVVYLRLARLGKAFAFHYSLNGSYWYFVRHFGLGEVGELRIGFSTQSPTGQGCNAQFSEIRFEEKCLGDLRSGE